MGTSCPVTCPAGQVQVPAARSMTKSSLGKCLLLGRPGIRATSFRPASAKVLTGTAVAVGGIPHGLNHRRPGVDLALLHQVSTRPVLSQALPGSTSTAVINCVSVSTTTAALCPSKRRLAALMAVAHLPDHAPTRSGPCSPRLSGSPRTISVSTIARHPPQRASHPGAAVAPKAPPHRLWSAAERCRLAVPPGPAEPTPRSRSASATISASNFRRACRSDQSMAASPFTLVPTYRL